MQSKDEVPQENKIQIQSAVFLDTNSWFLIIDKVVF